MKLDGNPVLGWRGVDHEAWSRVDPLTPAQLAAAFGLWYSSLVSNLAEIEAAADALPVEQKQELMLFLAARLRAQGARMPEPRTYSREQIAGWIAEDEADMQRFRDAK